MKELFIDCPTGLAGDMLLGSFLDLGISSDIIKSPLKIMGLDKEYSLNIQEGKSFGLRGKRISIEENAFRPVYRKWVDIERIISDAPLRESLKEKVLKVFNCLANAEASVHGIDVREVHFHEIGSIDTLVDVVGVCAALEYLNPLKVFCSIPPSGCGFVKAAHGSLPVPVPAVLELAKTHGVPLSKSFDQPYGELTTPTGLALMIVLADEFRCPELLGIKSVGIGLGTRTLDRPNLLRACLLENSGKSYINSKEKELAWESLVTQEAWIDDATPEDIVLLINRLREEGAIEVVSQEIQLKKGRQGQSIKALVKQKDVDKLRSIWFIYGTTIGLRENLGGRWVLSRRKGTCSTTFGKIMVKQVRRPDGRLSIKPEHDELTRISVQTGKSLDEIRQEVFLKSDTFSSTEEWTYG